MATDEWITFSEATEIIRARLDYSIGRAEAVVQQTKTSGEIRSLRSLMAFDGIIDPHNPPPRQAPSVIAGMISSTGSADRCRPLHQAATQVMPS